MTAALLLALLIPQERAITKLLDQLREGDYEARGAATEAIIRYGIIALPVLDKVSAVEDADFKAWVRIAKNRIEYRNPPPAGGVNRNEYLKPPKLLPPGRLKGKPIPRHEPEVLLYRNRLEDKRFWLARAGGHVKGEQALLSALRWLARHQSEDGSWKTTGFIETCHSIKGYKAGGNCSPNPGYDDYDVGNTGLALLAFVGAGYSHLSLKRHDGISFGEVIRKGIVYLHSIQQKDGAIGKQDGRKPMYGHAIATAALVETFGISKSQLLKLQAQKAVDYLVRSRNPDKAWRYLSRDGTNDTSVTSWVAHALIEARRAELTVPDSAFDGTWAWITEVTDHATGRVGYTEKGTSLVVIPEVSQPFSHHETLAATGILLGLRLGKDSKSWPYAKAAALLAKDPPRWGQDDKESSVDFYYWHYGGLALFAHDGPGGKRWRDWNDALMRAVLPNQVLQKGACKHGSWEPSDRWSFEGGRVYVTALGAMMLETPYRYPPFIPDRK